MTTLLLCGTGSTGQAIASLLHAANHPLLLTSRTGKAPSPYKAATFEWEDHATFENPWKVDPSIDRVYILSPAIYDIIPHAAPFIDLAITKGVKRFVLLSESQLGPGDLYTGKIHQYLVDKGVDHVVFRPTWFMQNFGRYFDQSIKEKNEIFSATGSGRIPWVSTQDFAQVAFEALTADECPNEDKYVFGPELYSYDEVCFASNVYQCNCCIHAGKKLTVAEFEETYVTFGVSRNHAKLLASTDDAVSKGFEENLYKKTPAEKKYIGKHKLSDYIRDNSNLWLTQ